MCNVVDSTRVLFSIRGWEMGRALAWGGVGLGGWMVREEGGGGGGKGADALILWV